MDASSQMISLLRRVWSRNCEEGDYIFISTKSPSGEWRDHPIEFHPDLDEVVELLEDYPSSEYDLYWCPLPFDAPRRRKERVKGSSLLWSDMDEVSPYGLDPEPTICWESSPGRFHGLWFLDDPLSAVEAGELNKSLTYYIGADKGGWDLTQVLRIPGTRNHKYPNKPQVKVVINSDRVYKVSELRDKLGTTAQPNPPYEEPKINLDPTGLLMQYRERIPRKALTLLLEKNVQKGKRSEILWYLEHTLREAGLTPPQIFTLIKHSAWNKYRGRSDEDYRLRKELEKIIEGSIKEGEEDEDDTTEENNLQVGLTFDSYFTLMSSLQSYPGWLVEGFWSRRSHGIVAGEPKSFKSTLVMDLAVSVASGKPFLGKFNVVESGPVLFIQNENADWILRDRLEKIISNRDLTGEVKENPLEVTFPPDLPIYFVNQQGFLLNDPIHREIMEKAIEKYKPLLTILDPLYLMFDGDINSAKDLNPVLNWLLKIKNQYHTGVLLIHHMNKAGQSARGGQRMLGSTTLHGWIESAWYIRTGSSPDDTGDDDSVVKVSGEPVSVVIEREFRAAGTYPKVELSIRMGEFGDSLYEVNVQKHIGRGRSVVSSELADQVLSVLSYIDGPISQRELAKRAGVGRRAMAKVLDELAENGKINIKKEGVELVDS